MLDGDRSDAGAACAGSSARRVLSAAGHEASYAPAAVLGPGDGPRRTLIGRSIAELDQMHGHANPRAAAPGTRQLQPRGAALLDGIYVDLAESLTWPRVTTRVPHGSTTRLSLPVKRRRLNRAPKGGGSGGAGDHRGAEVVEGVAGGAGGEGVEQGAGAVGAAATSARAWSMLRWRRSRSSTSARAASSCRSESSSSSSGRRPGRWTCGPAASAGSGCPRAGRCRASCRSRRW